MAEERARHLIRTAQDATTAVIRELQETEGLRHLYGRPLDLSDDSPEWFAHKLLKREGMAPPLVERGKDLDAARQAADAIVERVRRRRAWLSRPEARCTPEAAAAFNQMRGRALGEYRAALIELNREIRDFNLAAPSPLHRRGFVVDSAVAAVAREIPPLGAPAPAPMPPRSPSRLRSLWRKLRSGQ